MMNRFAFFNEPKAKQWLIKWRFLLPAILSLLVYSPTLFNGYSLDDELVIQNHPLTNQGLSALAEIWESPYYKDEMGYSYGYRPIVLSSFALEYSLWGNNLFLSHLLNIILYALLCTLILFWLEIILKKNHHTAAFAVAVLFALYPLHSEVVCSLKNREEILSLMGGISAAIFLFRTGSRPAADFAMALLLFVLGMLSKNTIFLFPLLLPLISFSGSVPFNLKLLLFGLIAPLPAAALLEVNNSLFVWIYILLCQLLVLGLWVYHSARTESAIVPDRKDWYTGFLNNYPGTGRTVLFTFLAFIFLFSCFYFRWVPGSYLLLGLLTLWALFSWNNGESALAVFLMLLSSSVFFLTGILPYIWTFTGENLLLISFLGALKSKGRSFILFVIIFFLTTAVSIYTIGAEGMGILILLPFILAYHLQKLPHRAEWFFYLLALFNILNLDSSAHKFLPSILINIPWAMLCIKLGYAKRKGQAMPELGSIVLLMFLAIVLVNGFAHNHLGGTLTSKPKTIYDLSKSAEVLGELKPSKMGNRPLSFIESPLDWQASAAEVSATSIHSLAWYIGKLFVPYPMVCYYGYKEFTATDWSSAEVILASLALILITLVLTLIAWRQNKYLLYLWLCLLLLLIPYSNAFTRVPGMVADRYTFLPSLVSSALLIAIFYSLTDHFKNRLRFLSQYFLMSIMLLYAGLTFSRTFDWKDRITLFRADVQKAPRSVQLNNLLGVQLMLSALNNANPANSAELAREAVQCFDRAIALYPAFFNLHYDKGRAWMFLNTPDSAIAAFRRGAKLNPDYPPLRSEMALALIQSGMRLEPANPLSARFAYQEAIGSDSSLADAYNHLAFSHYATGTLDTAIMVLQLGLQNAADKAELRANLGKIYLSVSRPAEAAASFRAALALKPGQQEWQVLLNKAESSISSK
jgi:hypothetical protein